MMAIQTQRFRSLETGWIEEGKVGNPVLLLLHGYPDAPSVWERQIEFFQKRFHVLCPFMRGVGPSQPSQRRHRYGPESVSLDLLSLLQERSPDKKVPVLCVGHDLGGIHAWELSRYLPERMKGLVLINGLSLEQIRGRLTDWRQWIRSWYVWAMQIPGVPEWLLSRYGKNLVNWAEQMGGLNPEQRVAIEERFGGELHPINQYRVLIRTLLKKPEPLRVQCPVLVLWGKDDPYIQPPTMGEMELHASAVTSRILEGGHWVFREKSEQVNHFITDFFDQSVFLKQKVRA